MHVECIPSMRGQDMMWAQECPMSLREHLRVILDLFRIRNTILIIRLPLNVIDH